MVRSTSLLTIIPLSAAFACLKEKTLMKDAVDVSYFVVSRNRRVGSSPAGSGRLSLFH
jgi:hypothetical protein